LARQGVGFGQGEKPMRSEERIRPAAMIFVGGTMPPLELVLAAQDGPQSPTHEAVDHREGVAVGMLEPKKSS
jgi:hypothetical protein